MSLSSYMSLFCFLAETIEASLDDWMRLMKYIIVTPVPDFAIPPNLEDTERSALQQYKAKKWALQVVHRFLVRCRPSSFNEDPKDAPENRLSHKFLKSWSCTFMESLIDLQKTERNNGVWISVRVKNLMLQYFTQCLELSLTYKSLKHHVEFILFEVCFPLLCYTSEDVETWEQDPAEFIRSQGIVLAVTPRDCGKHKM